MLNKYFESKNLFKVVICKIILKDILEENNWTKLLEKEHKKAT